ncbi:unnamed protein product [Prorocentrum cordatum]|uniref:FHA domain-containing protein n=1 Tax=Prorocentrum cordatum TaxID=2364126 RepID=A0ABN9SUU7_9DINO|nr:unnamed protein product [Polarella glacialis]
MAVEGVVSFRISHESGGNGAAPKQFTLAQGEDKAIRIGRAPGNDILVEHRGVSQYHAEVRLAEGGSEPRLCIRDLSMNGTGLKRPGSETPSSCPKNTDDALPDGAVILVPMMLKADAQRAWLRVQILEGEEAAAAAAAKPPAPAKAPRSAAPAAPRKEARRRRAGAGAGAGEAAATTRPRRTRRRHASDSWSSCSRPGR